MHSLDGQEELFALADADHKLRGCDRVYTLKSEFGNASRLSSVVYAYLLNDLSRNLHGKI